MQFKTNSPRKNLSKGGTASSSKKKIRKSSKIADIRSFFEQKSTENHILKKQGGETENKAKHTQESLETQPTTQPNSLAPEIAKFNSIHGEIRRPSPDRDKQTTKIICRMVTPPTRGSHQKTGETYAHKHPPATANMKTQD